MDFPCSWVLSAAKSFQVPIWTAFNMEHGRRWVRFVPELVEVNCPLSEEFRSSEIRPKMI